MPALGVAARGPHVEVLGDAGTVLQPPPGTLELSFGSFGPCELERDPDTRVAVVSCNKSGTDQNEKIFLNFYLPGIWSADPFDAESVARFLAESRNPDVPDVRVEGSFQAPDPKSHQRQFFLFSCAVIAERGYGQAVMVKVAPLRGAVYSLIYSRVLQGPARTMRATITEWFAEHLDAYGNEVFALRPDESWIDYLKAQADAKPPPRQKAGGR